MAKVSEGESCRKLRAMGVAELGAHACLDV